MPYRGGDQEDQVIEILCNTGVPFQHRRALLDKIIRRAPSALHGRYEVWENSETKKTIPLLHKLILDHAQHVSLEVVQYLQEKGQSVDRRDVQGLTALETIVMKERLDKTRCHHSRHNKEMVRLLLEAGADMHLENPKSGESPWDMVISTSRTADLYEVMKAFYRPKNRKKQQPSSSSSSSSRAAASSTSPAFPDMSCLLKNDAINPDIVIKVRDCFVFAR